MSTACNTPGYVWCNSAAGCIPWARCCFASDYLADGYLYCNEESECFTTNGYVGCYRTRETRPTGTYDCVNYTPGSEVTRCPRTYDCFGCGTYSPSCTTKVGTIISDTRRYTWKGCGTAARAVQTLAVVDQQAMARTSGSGSARASDPRFETTTRTFDPSISIVTMAYGPSIMIKTITIEPSSFPTITTQPVSSVTFVAATPWPGGSDPRLSGGAIAGIAIGAFLAIALVAVLGFIAWRRHKGAIVQGPPPPIVTTAVPPVYQVGGQAQPAIYQGGGQTLPIPYQGGGQSLPIPYQGGVQTQPTASQVGGQPQPAPNSPPPGVVYPYNPHYSYELPPGENPAPVYEAGEK